MSLLKLTNQEKTDLMRFGCAIRLKQQLLLATWIRASRQDALAASILARGSYTKQPAGPLFCLALEISPTSALPHYCYFPFNLRNGAHRKYLSRLIETGMVRLSLIVQGRPIAREHRLPPSQCRRIRNVCAEALEALKACGPTYRFPAAVKEFENTVRVPQLFERLVSGDQLVNALESARAAAEKIPPERRALAGKVVREFAEILKGRYGDRVRTYAEKVWEIKNAMLLLLDIEREFGDDYDRCVGFLADAVAANVQEEELKKVGDWPSKLELILRLADQMGSAPQAEQEKVGSGIANALGEILSDLSSGRGLSLSMLKNLLPPLKPLLTGQPGRPPRDYSQEYEWKKSGSWAKVARQHLQENPETRAEFNGRDYGFLTLEEREILAHRIREGVKSYAARMGKPYPVPREAKSSAQQLHKNQSDILPRQEP